VSVESDRLARLLAERLNEIAPPGFRVAADGGMLFYSATATVRPAGSSGTHVGENFGDGSPLAERIRAVSEQALDEFQDYVAEATTEPWPGQRQAPAPHAEVRGPRVHLWYGAADAPVLECSPIDLP
jgi:hypothetical protein